MKTSPSKFKGDELPIEQVSWEDCHAFCQKTAFRLPTDAEWEYACRAGTAGAYGGTDRLDEMGWYYENSGGQRLDETKWPNGCDANQNQPHSVGKKRPNAWGVYDMHGNVWEWCLDWYHTYSSDGVVDPINNTSGEFRVIRGGSWLFQGCACRSASRSRSVPDHQNPDIGFRVVRPTTP